MELSTRNRFHGELLLAGESRLTVACSLQTLLPEAETSSAGVALSRYFYRAALSLIHTGAVTVSQLGRASRSHQYAGCCGSRISPSNSSAAHSCHGETPSRRGPVRACPGPVHSCLSTAGACLGPVHLCLGPIHSCLGPIRACLGPVHLCPGTVRPFHIPNGACPRETVRRFSARLPLQWALRPIQQTLSRIPGYPRRVSSVPSTL